MIHALETVWIQRHGYPNKIRLDAEGAFRGTDLGSWASEAGVELDVIPAEDHGQIGGVERMGGVLKHHAHVLTQTNPEMDPFRALALMAGAHNESQFVNGYTPMQWAFGRQFAHDRRLFDGGHADPLHCSEGTPGSSFQENLQARIKAEVVFKKAQAARRVTLAMNSRTTPHEVFIPGDLVYYKRVKPPADHPASEGFVPKHKQARWYGPVRVLASETRSDADGRERRPAGVVWAVSHGRLKRCSPWQLRHASVSEAIVAEGARAPTPTWMFHDLIQHLHEGQYETYDDITLPEDTMIQPPRIVTPGTIPRAGDPPPPSAVRGRSTEHGRDPSVARRGRSRSRVRNLPSTEGTDADMPSSGKRKQAPSPGDQASSSSYRPTWLEPEPDVTLQQLLNDPKYSLGEHHVLPSATRHDADAAALGRTDRSGELMKNEQFLKQKKRREKEERVQESEAVFANTVDEHQGIFALHDHAHAVCQLELQMPQTSSQWRAYRRDERIWAAQMLRKTEVRWSSLNPSQKAEFEKAKMMEVDQWLQAEATKAIEGHIDPQRTVRMRWVLSWKDHGRAKARIVLIGFEDPDLDTLVSSSPTMCRRTRQLALQFAAQKGWKCLKADIKAAFLQGPASQEARNLFAVPVDELADALKIPRGQAIQIRKAAHGLVNAPAEFYKAVKECLLSLGSTPMVTEPCGWVFKVWDEHEQKYVTQGLVTSHVDDFIVCGNESCELWIEAIHRFYARFRWSDWEHTAFSHCGIDIRECQDGSKILDHSRFCETLEQIPIYKDRADREEASDKEKSQLRALLGAAQWRAYNSGPQHAAKVGLFAVAGDYGNCANSSRG